MAKEVVREKLVKLKEIIQTLKEFQEIEERQFVNQRRIYFGAIYALVVGIEVICDLGNHILSYYFGRKADSYKDIILQLAEVGVIPEKFAQKTKKMVDFRNLAIHVYARVDPEKVYQYLPLAIKQFQEYLQYFLDFLTGKEKDVSKMA